MVRKLVSRGLAELEPAEVLEVEDGLAAQQVLLERAVDVVVTDVLMPKMDGRELMKWAQEHCPEPLWIVLSGLETFDAAVNALQLGAFDYLAKPPEVQRVRVAVRNALDQIELVRERKRLYAQIEQSNSRLAEKVQQLERLCRMLEEQAEIIQADLDRAEIIQHALLPQDPPDIDGWVLETLYRSGSSVGGDFYDIVLLDNHHAGLVVADAAGHGVAAAMAVGAVQAPVEAHRQRRQRAHAEPRAAESQPASARDGVGAGVVHHRGLCAPQPAHGERADRVGRASALHLDLPGTANRGCWNAPDRRSAWWRMPATRRTTCTWTWGDRLLLYTDGVLEGGADSPTHEELARSMLVTKDRANLLSTLYRAAAPDVGGERDDITMILLERGEGVSRFDDTPLPGERRPAEPPTAQAQLLQGVADKRAFISIAGTATWIRSQAFYEAALKLLERFDNLTVDLGACEYLDQHLSRHPARDRDAPAGRGAPAAGAGQDQGAL